MEEKLKHNVADKISEINADIFIVSSLVFLYLLIAKKT
jgi:hypothetical protein